MSNKRSKQADAVEKLYGKKATGEVKQKPKPKARITPYKVSKNSVGLKIKVKF